MAKTKISRLLSKLLGLRTFIIISALITASITGLTFVKRQRHSSAQSIQAYVNVYVSPSSAGSIQVNSGGHQFGSCNTGAGVPFYIPANCYGYRFGPPDGVTIYLNQGAPNGYQFTGWSVTYNATDTGDVSCNSSYCYLNFNSGTANIQANFKPNPPSNPSPYVASVTTNSITLKWFNSQPGGGASIASYSVIENSRSIGSTTSGTTQFVHSGITCNTSHTYYVAATDNWGQTTYGGPVTGKTAACPVAPQPQPSPTPTPTPSPTPTPTPQPSSGSLSGGSGSHPPSGQTATPAVTDTTPPGVPTGFQATMATDSTTVLLSWDLPSDKTSVSGYTLERSTDGQIWDSITKDTKDTFYKDSDVMFKTKYIYRLAAFDSSMNFSEFAMTGVTTNSFASNAGPNKDLALTSPDGLVTMFIQAGTLNDDALCDIQEQVGSLGPVINDYNLVAGPYGLVCKKSDGTALTSFNKPIDVTVTVSKNDRKKYGSINYFSQDHEQWNHIKVTGKDKRSGGDKFQLNNAWVFAVMGKTKHTPVWIKLIFIIFSLTFIVATTIFGIVWWRRRRLEDQYDDYWRKSKGY
jgi:hypothetical protein